MALSPHIKPGPIPWRVVLVLDDHLGPTEALVEGRTCGTPLLIELLDWRHPLRLFRAARPAEDAVASLMRDLNRGSCDLNRAGEEVRHFSLEAERLPELLLVDVDQQRLIEVIEPDVEIPRSPWRELPCDGSWLDRFGTQAARL